MKININGEGTQRRKSKYKGELNKTLNRKWWPDD